MPDWKIHLFFGCLFAVFWFSFFYFEKFLTDPLRPLALLLISLFVSTFPDVDLKRSKSRNLVSFLLAFSISAIYALFYIETWFYAPFYFLILYFLFKYLPSKHRGFIHSFKFSILLSAALTLIFYFFLGLGQMEAVFWFSIIFLSYSIHLVLDRI